MPSVIHRISSVLLISAWSPYSFSVVPGSSVASLASRRRRAFARWILAASAILAAFAVGPQTIVAQDAGDARPLPRHPVAYGAPFVPSGLRTSAVMDRAQLLMALDELDVAEEALASRSGSDETMRILASQRAALERDLDALQPSLDLLAEETAPFGITVGAFPVDELRKPFRNDWGEPRSGGRRHQGNDMLAQMHVPLRAIEDGYYEKTTNGTLGGLSVYLIGDSGARYYYAHLETAADLVEGQRVYAGQFIGTNGDSGNAAGSPHLHLQIAPDGGTGWENPYPLMAALFGPQYTPDADSYGPPNARS